MEQLTAKECLDESTDFLIQAQSYLVTAARAFDRRKCYTAENIYNLLRSSIEKFFIGFFICNQHRPVNCTITDLVTSFKQFRHIDEELEKELMELGTIQFKTGGDAQGESCVGLEYIERLFVTAQRVSQMVIAKLDNQ